MHENIYVTFTKNADYFNVKTQAPETLEQLEKCRVFRNEDVRELLNGGVHTIEGLPETFPVDLYRVGQILYDGKVIQMVIDNEAVAKAERRAEKIKKQNQERAERKAAKDLEKVAKKPKSEKHMNDKKWQAEKWAKDVPYELSIKLDEFETDDEKMPTLAEAVAEARYIQSLYNEGGTISSEELGGDHGVTAQKAAQKTVRDCEKFIRKYA